MGPLIRLSQTLVDAACIDHSAAMAVAFENNLCPVTVIKSFHNDFLVVHAGNVRAIYAHAPGLVQRPAGSAYTAMATMSAMETRSVISTVADIDATMSASDVDAIVSASVSSTSCAKCSG